ncbi:MAG: hypothetical protein A3D10_06835 [Omnitrophica WOR_2 bacterium RIFCSPHIGHO2_02_FULL_48_11]|nr:MAG: hypothetical protein A3D10_06835 [Omnitrophica WOR_2 bacterium RIFCSPHIGHO2_02_FULL_48_11]
MGSVAFIFIIIFIVLMGIPCVGVAWIGTRLINQLGRYPSRTPAIQLSVVLKLVVLEVVSWTLLLLFFKILVAE